MSTTRNRAFPVAEQYDYVQRRGCAEHTVSARSAHLGSMRAAFTCIVRAREPEICWRTACISNVHNTSSLLLLARGRLDEYECCNKTARSCRTLQRKYNASWACEITERSSHLIKYT